MFFQEWAYDDDDDDDIMFLFEFFKLDSTAIIVFFFVTLMFRKQTKQPKRIEKGGAREGALLILLQRKHFDNRMLISVALYNHSRLRSDGDSKSNNTSDLVWRDSSVATTLLISGRSLGSYCKHREARSTITDASSVEKFPSRCESMKRRIFLPFIMSSACISQNSRY